MDKMYIITILMNYYFYLVETKKEYTIHLINVLTPLIYEGIASIYEEAKNNTADEELRLFQGLLRKIPSWNEYLIEQETNRIVKISSKGNIIEDLIKAVIKSNIMLLTNTPPDKKENIRINHDITTSKFIHNSYIEVARNIFQNPYLFYHKYNSFELKKNQREANEVIKKSIEQSIRKLLPMNIILQNYLGDSFEHQSNDFQNSIPDSEYNKLRHLLNKDPVETNYELVKKDDINELDKTQKNNQNVVQTINFQYNVPKTNSNIKYSENFKTLKELANKNITEIDNKVNNILLKKTEEAIKESDKHSEKLGRSENFEQSEKLEKPKSEKLILEKQKSEKLILEKQKSEKRQASEKKASERQVSEKKELDSEEDSVSYFKPSNKTHLAEVYDNNKNSSQPKKPYINFDILNNTSVNLKSIMEDLSEIDNNLENNPRTKNKKKYFNNNNL